MAPVRKNTELVPISTLPVFFDKARLLNPEFDKYYYEIKFKKSGKTVRGMTVAGHLHAIHPFLKSIKSDIVQYGLLDRRNILSCVVKVTVTVSYKPSEDSEPIDVVVEAFGDGDVQEAPSAAVLVRTAETRALNRALERLLDVSKADFNNEFVGEDESGTPATREIDDENHRETYRKSPQEIKAEKEKKYADDGDELDADQASDNGNVSNTAGSTKASSEDDDW